MANEKFYPTLADLIAVNELPDQLGFIKDELVNFFSKLL